jgi:hypothetical protein
VVRRRAVVCAATSVYYVRVLASAAGDGIGWIESSKLYT